MSFAVIRDGGFALKVKDGRADERNEFLGRPISRAIGDNRGCVSESGEAGRGVDELASVLFAGAEEGDTDEGSEIRGHGKG